MEIKKPLAFVIEDDEDLAIIFSESLMAAGFETEIIGNGQQAMKRIGVTAPRLILLDIYLPEVSGIQILDAIRSDPRPEYRQINVIVATADPRAADQVRGSANTVLVKPISFSQLRDLTANLN